MTDPTLFPINDSLPDPARRKTTDPGEHHLLPKPKRCLCGSHQWVWDAERKIWGCVKCGRAGK